MKYFQISDELKFQLNEHAIQQARTLFLFITISINSSSCIKSSTQITQSIFTRSLSSPIEGKATASSAPVGPEPEVQVVVCTDDGTIGAGVPCTTEPAY